MKTSLFFLILFSISALIVKSQQKPIIELSKPYPIISCKNKQYVRNEDNILAIKNNNIQLWGIEKLNLLKNEKYELPDGAQIEELCEINDQYAIFYSVWDKINETELLYYKIINIENGNINKEGKLILKVNGRVSHNFNFQKICKGSKILIQYRLNPVEKRDEFNYDIIGFCIVDNNLDVAYKKQVKMPYTEKKMDMLDYYGDNLNNIYILAKVFHNNTTKNVDDLGLINYHLELLKLETEDESISKIQIKLEEKSLGSLFIYEIESGDIKCCGYTFSGKRADNVDGIILFKIDKNGLVYDINQFQIPAGIIEQNEDYYDPFVSEEEEKSEKMKELQLRQIIIQKDGSIIIIGEQYYIETKISVGYQYSNVQIIYHFNSILVTKIDNSGQLAWMKKLPKQQKGMTGMSGMSYKYMEGEDCHYFLYIDNVKNMQLDTDESAKQHINGMGGYLTAYKLNDATGEASKFSILNTKNVNGIEIFQFSINRLIPISLHSFVFEVYKKQKEDILIKVTL
ncbi:MAG: hypothetical protein HY951_16280 [Bacteroidia bacterium]|nr:hypothetical protein [Bacteroidia bacterium]